MNQFLEIIEIKPEHLDEYVELHKHVWPELLVAEEKAGIKKEVIFIHKNFSVIYSECEDYEASDKALRATDICKKWDAFVKPWFAGQNVFPQKVYSLTEQLAKARAASGTARVKK
jgi:L-rhamnose mutarotase